MRVTFWGTRGSLPTPGHDTMRYGGNTSCVEVRGEDGTVLILDAGSGIRGLGVHWPDGSHEVHILISHLHMDHIQGLGFFAPLKDPDMVVHIYGPPSPSADLGTRLRRYLSPPLFPVRLRDLPCTIELHEVTGGHFQAGGFTIEAGLVIHPGPTLGYRVQDASGTLAYLPDHEPALGAARFPIAPEWTSGHALAAGADLLIHDAQYTLEEYGQRVGWGHSAMPHALAFACQARAKHLALFHHDPMHGDLALDHLVAEARRQACPQLSVSAAHEGETHVLSPAPAPRAAPTSEPL